MKIAIINHGAPGSGMSTMANAIRACLKQADLQCTIHSTDNFFMCDGEYRFNALYLAEYHNRNLNQFKQDVHKGVDCVICDNTNLKKKDANPYIKFADANGYLVIEVYYTTDEVSAHIARCPVTIPRATMKNYVDKADYGYSLDIRITITPEKFITQLESVPRLIKKFY